MDSTVSAGGYLRTQNVEQMAAHRDRKCFLAALRQGPNSGIEGDGRP